MAEIRVPMINLKQQCENLREEAVAALTEVFMSAHYVLGPRVERFETSVAEYIGTSGAVGVASGTDALHLAVKTLGIGPGDEVITTPFTFFATVEAIAYEDATPVFVDIDPETYNIDVTRIEAAITPRTKAIIPVHLYGHPAEMGAILDIAARHNLVVIEDCAQSFGASIDGKRTGSFGDAGCFSFYPSKNLGAIGDAGIITVKKADIFTDLRKFRNHGTAGLYLHADVGFNSRLDEVQAAILLIKLKRIDEYTARRRERAALYTELLKGTVKTPVELPGCMHVYHQYTIRHPERDRIREALAAAGIASNVYYPVPMHLQPAMEHMGLTRGALPVAEQAADEVLSLPICPEISEETVRQVADVIRRA
jgi:dTDP-4-amino-4,6-dideoxygalactose transaminase